MNVQRPRQSAGKRAAKIFLPVLIGLLITFLCDRIILLIKPLNLSIDGDAAIGGQWVFNNIFFPIIVIALFLAQWLVIIPFWGKMLLKFRNVLLSSIITALIIAIISGALFGYMLWAPQFGFGDLVISFLVISSITMIYIVGDIFALYFLDIPFTKYSKANKLKTN